MVLQRSESEICPYIAYQRELISVLALLLHRVAQVRYTIQLMGLQLVTRMSVRYLLFKYSNAKSGLNNHCFESSLSLESKWKSSRNAAKDDSEYQ